MHLKKNSIILASLLSLYCTPISFSQSAEKIQKNGSVNPSGKFIPHNTTQNNAANKQSQQQLKELLQLKNLDDNKLKIGDILLDKEARTVSFPVQVNMKENFVEYFLVSNKGKLHESVFSTTVSPTLIHFSCLLLGVQPVSIQNWPKNNTQIDPKNAVSIHLTWPTNGPPKVIPLTSCVVKNDLNTNTATEQTMNEGPFFYSGSRFHNEIFLTESEGSIISVIADSSALINGIRSNLKNGMQYSANKNILPDEGITITMVLTFPAP